MDNIPTPVLLGVVIGISVLLLIGLVFWLHKRQFKNVDEDMQSWLKRSKDDLLTAWGPPTSVFPMENGKEIWSYNKIKQRTDVIHGKEYGGQTQTPEQYIVKRDFFINENGIIFHFRWENW